MHSQSTMMQQSIPASEDVSEGAGKSRDYRSFIRALKARDNYTNFVYIGKIWLIGIATITGALWSFSFVASQGLGWWWNIPVAAIAVLIMGATQHQLGGIVHEGTHFILFDNRKLNELASDWLGAFPIYTSTYAFRLHHLAHHQFVNDPERDPNFAQAEDSGHWLDFPVAHVELMWSIIRQLSPVRLVSYIAARARYSALSVGSNPYADPDAPSAPWTVRWGIIYTIAVPLVSILLLGAGRLGFADATLMGELALGFTAAATVAIVTYYALQPESAFPQSRLDPVISHRMTAVSRMLFMALMYGGLTAAEFATGAPAWGYFGLFWVLPLFSTFPVFMILREWVQHGNADRGRYTNSRVFLVNPFLRYAVFPFGMDYHLPHHIMAAVPHYKLKDLHELLLEKDPQYAEKAQIVEGWSGSGERQHPSIVEVLGPEYAASGNTVFVDDATLEYASVNNKDAVEAQKAASRQQAH